MTSTTSDNIDDISTPASDVGDACGLHSCHAPAARTDVSAKRSGGPVAPAMERHCLTTTGDAVQHVTPRHSRWLRLLGAASFVALTTCGDDGPLTSPGRVTTPGPLTTTH